MRRSLVAALALSVALGSFTGSARAQIKFPVFDPESESQGGVKNVVYQDAKDAADYKHGTRMALTLKNDTKVIGTLVRVDRKNKRIYLRTQAEAAPVGYAEADLKRLPEKAVYGGAAKDGIRPAGDASGSVIQSEITRRVIYNGSQRSVQYYSTVVSPGEREALEQMERAENDLIALEDRTMIREAALGRDRAFQEETVRTQKLVNDTIQLVNGVNSIYLVADDMHNTLVLTHPRKEAVIHVPQVAAPQINYAEIAPPVNPESLSKAREAMRLSLNRGIYEDGRLVAVVYDDARPIGTTTTITK